MISMDSTYQHLSTSLLQFPPKNENIKVRYRFPIHPFLIVTAAQSAMKLNEMSFETAESFIIILEGTVFDI
jgi:hypothetical protein